MGPKMGKRKSYGTKSEIFPNNNNKSRKKKQKRPDGNNTLQFNYSWLKSLYYENDILLTTKGE